MFTIRVGKLWSLAKGREASGASGWLLSEANSPKKEVVRISKPVRQLGDSCTQQVYPFVLGVH